MSSFNKWCKFIKNKNKPRIPANPVHLSLFVTHLMNIGSSYHVISSAIYSIKCAHSILVYSDPTINPFIKSLLDSSKRHNKPRITKKEPVSTSNLINLCDHFKGSSNFPPSGICAWFWFPSSEGFYVLTSLVLSCVPILRLWETTWKCSFREWSIDSKGCYIGMSC